MKRENWEQVKDIFNRALDVVPGERDKFLSKHCAGDEDLRRDVEILISSFDSSESFLKSPAVGAVAELIDEQSEKLKVGETINQYKILGFIGAGGMGEVYLAQDTILNRRVALKVVSNNSVASNSHKRFLREARTAAALEHPHICAIYEIAESDEKTFIVMQYVEGETLCEKLKQENLSLHKKVEIAAQIADALAEAHARQIVHRDIKPANLILTRRGQIKVLDFGLAKIVSENERHEGHTTLSNAGMVMGTVAYMSPEQARGQKVDGRTDVWSLGVVLYEMLTGKLPFAGETASDTIAAILKTEPPAIQDVPEYLASIVSKALAKDYQARYSAEEMLADLRSAQKRLDSIPEHSTVQNFLTTDPTIHVEIDTEASRQSDSKLPARTTEIKRRTWLFPVFGVAAAIVLSIAGYHFFINPNTFRPNAFKPTVNATTTNANFSRRSVALVGFKDLSNQSDTAWLSPALVEMLSTELGAGDKLRVIPQENIARMKNELALSDANNLTPEVLGKIWSNLNAELVVAGSYVVLNDSRGEKIRLDVRVLDASTGDTAASVAESGTKAELFELISHIGARLREMLGAGFLSDSEKNSLRTSLPSNAEATRLFAEGREKLNNFDFLAARDLLVRAVAMDPKFPLSHQALAIAFQKLGEEVKAKEEAQKAFELSNSLRREERLAVEGFYRDISGEWEKATEIYKTLFDFFPDSLEYGLRLVAAQNRAGKSTDAQLTVENLRKLPVPISDDPRIDISEGDVAESLSDYNRELTVARQAAAKGLARNSSLLVAEARYYEGWALWNLGNNPAALTAYEEARKIYSDAGRRKSVADILNAIAVVHWKQGELDDALKIYEECLVIMRETGSKIGAAAVLNNIANIYKDRDELASARRYYEDALAMEKEIGIKSRICVDLYNLAGVRRMQGDLPEAQKLYEQALAIAREAGRKATITMALQELAELFYYRGDLPAAKTSAEESLVIAREIKRRSSEAYTLTTLGRIAMAENELDSAHKFFEEALELRREMKEEGEIAESQMALAQLVLAESRPLDALSLAREAADAFARQHAAADEAEARALIALAHLENNDPSAAGEEIKRAGNLIEKSQNKLAYFNVRIAEARSFGAANRLKESNRILQQIISEANRIGFTNFALEARLVSGDILLNSGDRARARAQFSQLSRDASAHNFKLLAQKANNKI